MPCPDDTKITEFVARALPATLAARIEAHVADCTECRNLVFALASSAQPPGLDEQSIERIGRFEVEGVIGRGAMGVVYRARDPELDRIVAVKVRRTQARLEVDGEDRLRREAQALARLTHPNVVVVYETGRDAGIAYVAMEYVDGVTLDDWLAKPRSRDDVVALMLGAGRGLAAAHAAGLVHRDFKPRNVFVSSDNVPKVGDFGLVRVEPGGASAPASADLTMTLSVMGSIVGTPAYMAPEQLAGEAATEASDQFSFCVTLFEAVYGKRPFLGTTIDELAEAMTRAVQVPVAPRVSTALRQVLQRGLDRDPRQRFATMGALLERLATQPIRKWRIAAASLVTVATITGVTLAATRSNDASDACGAPDAEAVRVFAPERTQAILKAFAATGARNADAVATRVVGLVDDYRKRWQAASVTTCRATAQGRQSAQLGDRQRACLERRLQQAEELGSVLAAVKDPQAVTQGAAAVLALPDVDVCTRADDAVLGSREPPPADKAAEAKRVETTLDRITSLVKLGEVTTAGAEIDAVIAAARALAYSPVLARALLVQSVVYSAIDRYPELEAILDEAAREAAKAKDDRLAAEAWTRRVYAVGVHFARYDDAHKWASAADAAVLRAGNPPDLRSGLHMNVGTLLIERGKLDEAQHELEAALELRTRHMPYATIQIADVHNNLAALLQRQGKMDEAQAQFEKALELYRSVHGDQHPDVFETYINLGFLFTERDQPAKALAYLEKARALGELVLGPDHVNVGITLDTMGLAKVSLGAYAEAAALHRKAYEIMLAKLGPKHPRTGYALGNLARAAQRLADYPAAIAAYRECATILTEALGATHDIVGRIHSGLGTVYMLTGDLVHAKQEYEAALAIFEGNKAQDEIGMARANLAQLALQRGRVTEARNAFASAFTTLLETAGPASPHTLTAQAGVIYCDAVQRHVDSARLVALDQVLDATKIDEFEPHIYGFLAYARARGHAAIGDKQKARELATASADAYAKAKLETTQRDVEAWRDKELR